MSILIRESRRLARQALDGIGNCRRHWHRARLRQRVERLLASDLPHRFYDDEATFERLQARYPKKPDYGYDLLSAWRRGVERTGRLIRHLGISDPGVRILEVGCGDGMVSAMLHGFGHDVTLCDFDDWRDERARDLPFVRANVDEGADLPESSFDVVCSYNAFEHFGNPASTLGHLVPLLRPGGRFYTEFGPLYASPWGLHAYTTINVPYPQFLFSRSFNERMLKKVGIRSLGRDTDRLQPLNEWRVRRFDELWRSVGCEMIHYESGESTEFLDLVLEFPHAFCGIDLHYEDLVTQHVSVTLRR